MAVRRPRIKAAALLTTKRKPRDAKTDNSVKVTSNVIENSELAKPSENDGNDLKDSLSSNEKSQQEHEQETRVEDEDKTIVKDVEEKPNIEKNIVYTCMSSSENVVEHDRRIDTSDDTGKRTSTNTENSFKCPASIDHTRGNSQNISNVGVDDVFYTDMEDLQKNVGEYPSVPSKQQSRQRIRPVPLFQRRNSLVGAVSPAQGQTEDNAALADIQSQQSTQNTNSDPTESIPIHKIHPASHRRERHYSASMIQTSHSSIGQHHHTPHKFTPTMGLGRIRTESNCSAFSDSFVTPSKIRKIDEHNSRSNHRRDFTCRIVNGNLDKSSLKMFDLIYYNPTTNPMEKRTAMSNIKKESKLDEKDAKIPLTDSKEEIPEDTKNAMPVPQLKLNANGDLILDEKTLEIETTAEQEARKVLANSSLIFLDENTGMNGFYKRQKRTKEWPPEETIKFYRCLQTVGTDFSLMCQLFPKRTRRDLKLKFKREERTNLALINKALLYPKLFNIDDLKIQLETEERDREETLQRWKEIHQKEAKTVKHVKINSSAAARSLKHGDEVYDNENVVKRKISRRCKPTEKKKSESYEKGKVTQKKSFSADNSNLAEDHQNVAADNSFNSNEDITSKTKATATSSSTPQTPIKQETGHLSDYSVKAEHNNNDNNLLLKSRVALNTNFSECAEISQIDEYYMNYVTNTETGENEITTSNQVKCDVKTIVDLDDGTVNTLENDNDLDILDTMPATPATSLLREVDECDMQQILLDLEAGSLVLISTLDSDNADQVINEIYMIDKTTGELCEKPLDIPESIVQSVLSVMS